MSPTTFLIWNVVVVVTGAFVGVGLGLVGGIVVRHIRLWRGRRATRLELLREMTK